MDWARAKNIVIIALVITNLFLLVIYGGKMFLNARQEENLYEDTMRLLEARDILLDAELPEEQGKMAVLTVDTVEFNVKKLDILLGQETALPENRRSQRELEGAAENFLHKAGLWQTGTYPTEFEEMGDRLFITYGIKINEVPLEGPELYCLMQDGKVGSVAGFWVSTSALGQSARETISPVEALLLFAGQQARRAGAIRITDIRMVYWIDREAMEQGETVSDTAFPYWKITYTGGESYINAYGE
ncbi:MAG: hypothetical protein IJC68_00815 [Firmicutes bacterium]|nr:hypothetical protein [Bacillota bacterium]